MFVIKHCTWYLYIFYSNVAIVSIFFLFLTFLFFNLMKLREKSSILSRFSIDQYKFYATTAFLIGFILISLKFIIYLFFVKRWLLFVLFYTHKIEVFNHFSYYMSYGVFTSTVGFGLLVLCYCTTILCLLYLGDRDIFLKGNSVSYFMFFLVCTTVMVESSNLLTIFLSFEFIFLPSLYFVFALGYVKKVDKTIYYLLLWTLFGSFLVLCGIGYIYSIHKTLDFQILITKKFSFNEFWGLYLTFFIGFGMKLPIFPFHYWLTKVHVEAPAGFSMFLSGFLVKTALYCFYYFSLLFTTSPLKIYFLIWVCVCIIEASIKMWIQVDIKKLIAFATIQEMNMLLFCVLLFQFINDNIIVIFFLMHGILSTLMFFLVDQVQKRAQTRNINLLHGFGSKYTSLRIYTWVMLLLFFGFPLTVKFIIEWYIGFFLLTQFGVFGMFIFFISMVVGSVGFARCWFLILYGQTNDYLDKAKGSDLYHKNKTFIHFLVYLLCILHFFLLLF